MNLQNLGEAQRRINTTVANGSGQMNLLYQMGLNLNGIGEICISNVALHLVDKAQSGKTSKAATRCGITMMDLQ